MVFESPADFAERTAIRISQSFEKFEDTLAATEGRHPSPDLSVVQQADDYFSHIYSTIILVKLGALVGSSPT